MTRQRSGSTALMSLLSQHPKVEAFDGEPLDVNEEHAARRLASLGITEHDLRHNAGGSLRRILSTCRAPACAVKVQSADVHAPATAASLLDGAPYGSIHVVALERNAHDEFASWKKAVTTGIWDATPKLQAAHREFGDTACDTANGCWKDPELVNKTSFTDFERRHDAWFREIAALRQHAPLLWLKTEDFFRAPEEEAQRVFDFLGLERADVSLKAYEEAKVKKYVAAPRSVAAPLVAPPPPPFPPLGPGVTIGVKHTSGFADRQQKLCRLLASIREAYSAEGFLGLERSAFPIIVAYDGKETYEAGREPCTGADTTFLHLGARGGLSAGRNAIVRHAETEFVMIVDDDDPHRR